MTQIDQTELNAADREAHIRLAAEQSAMHVARLALSRWACGYCLCDPLPCQPPSPQSRWHAAAQSDFALWLAAGGFAQGDAGAEPAEAGVAAASPAPVVGWGGNGDAARAGQRRRACTV